MALTVLWLPLAGGGTDPGPLHLVEIVTFTALTVLVLSGSIAFASEHRNLLIVLALVLVGATISTIFSVQLTKSVPLLIEWFWLAAITVLTLHLVRSGFSSWMVGMLLLALAAQVFWAYLLWVIKGSPSALHFGTFYAPNQYAGFVLMLTPVLVGLALRAGGVMFVAMGVLSAAALSSIFLSGSRGGVVAALFALIAVGILYRRPKQWVRLAVVVGVSGVIAWVAVIAIGGSARVPLGSNERPGISQKFTDNPQSLQMRLRWAKGAVLIGASHPLTGAGLGTFGDEFFKIRHPDWDWSLFAHNQYLEVFAEGGVLMFAGMVLIPLVALRRRTGRWPHAGTEEFGWKVGCWAGLFGASLHLLVDHDWSYPAFAATFLIIAALNVGSSTDSA